MSKSKLVPVEPTPEMLAAGEYALGAGCHASGIYADMLAAAPAAQWEPVSVSDALRQIAGWMDDGGIVRHKGWLSSWWR